MWRISTWILPATIPSIVALLSINAWSIVAKDKTLLCTCGVGDSCWPSEWKWQQLNGSLGGKLFESSPPATVCHEPNFNATACAELRDLWIWPQAHEDAASIMSPFFQNSSCDPFTPATEPCQLGNNPSYFVRVSSVADVQRTLEFAKKYKLRIVIKNTGHDYMGKSTGRGAVALWMHHLRSIEFLNYASTESSGYSGAAVRMGAGVLGYEASQAASRRGLRLVTGFCPSVGVAGGYTQGGGHSPLSTQYGLAADQVLEWEVVTARGEHLFATPFQNSDLYWAMSGGGAGSYAIAISLTVRAHADGQVGGASLSFSSHNISKDSYWEAFNSWQNILPRLVDAGATAGFAVMRDAFFIAPVTAPGKSAKEVESLLEPFTTDLKKLNIQFNLEITSKPNFWEHYTSHIKPLPDGPYTVNQLFGGRMIPRRVIETQGTELSETIRDIVEHTNTFFGFVALDVHTADGRLLPVFQNAVLPAWRKTLVTVLVQSTWNFTAPRSDGIARANEITNSVVPRLAALTPDSGVYMNEGDFQLQNWREDFYGTNLLRLEGVKSKYDPEGVFYTRTGIGSEAWSMDGEGRLCRASTDLKVWRDIFTKVLVDVRQQIHTFPLSLKVYLADNSQPWHGYQQN